MDHITINATHAAIQYAAAPGRLMTYRSVGTGDPFILCNRFRGNLDDWDPAFLVRWRSTTGLLLLTTRVHNRYKGLNGE